MRKQDILKMQISRVKKEIRDTPYDKSSEHHHGVLKAKLARLEEQLESPMNKGGGGGVGYAIKHSGDATVVLVGLPSVGKSTLLNKLTNAESKVGNYDFTTLGVVPGMMEYKGVKIQFLDLPGIVERAADNKGFGKKVLSVIRSADLVVLLSDVNRLNWFAKMENELYQSGIRPNQRPAKIEIKKMNRGAIQVVDPYKSFGKETVVAVAKEMGVSNAVIMFGERVDKLDNLVDVLIGNRKYLPLIKVVSKIDIKKVKLEDDWLAVSAEEGVGLDKLREKIWQELGLIRVYLKKSRQKAADTKEPLIVKSGQTMGDVAAKISSQMKEEVSRVCIWGEKARFPGQEVSFSFEVFDEMEVWFGK